MTTPATLRPGIGEARLGTVSGRLARAALASCLLVTLVACARDGGGHDADPVRTRRAPVTATRDCGTAAFGPGADAHPVVANSGPERAITVIGSPPRPSSDSTAYQPRPGAFVALKSPVIVAAGAAVTVTIPLTEQDSVALLFGGDDDPVETLPSGQRLFRLQQGETSVLFEACQDRVSPFTGYFLVDGPRCVQLDIELDEQSERIVVPFGLAECSEPTN